MSRGKGQGAPDFRAALGKVVAGAVLLAGALVPGGPRASAGEDPRGAVRGVRELLEAGQAAQALEHAFAAIGSAPTDAELLLAASDAAAAADRRDEALWLAGHARLAAIAAGRRADDLAPYEERVAALDPLPPERRAPLDAHAEAWLALGRHCAKRRLWINAVDALARLEGGPKGPQAEWELERIFRDRKAMEALLDSQIDVPSTATDRKVRTLAAAEDAQHADWAQAWEIESENYTVRTNSGYELGHRISGAMEQIHGFYRSVFGVKPKAEVDRCFVRLYRSEAEYREIGRAPEEAMAFYSPAHVSVSGYDPRSEGRPLSTLWSTLFHEASHQFTHITCGTRAPVWLNEGTASYFEGCRLRPDGRVERNLVPAPRLEGLVEVLDTGTPAVRDVISWPGPESYPAPYYDVGWGLVYFLRNYEDEKFDRPYLPLYEALLASYQEDGGDPPLERFVRYFVTDAKQRDVGTFEEFEARFTAWIRDLAYRELGPAQSALDFLKRARERKAARKYDAAEEEYRRALARMPSRVDVLTELSELLVKRNRRDEGLALLRRVEEAIRRDGIYAAGFEAMQEEQAQAACRDARERLRKLDPALAGLVDALDGFGPSAYLESASRYVEEGCPRTALAVIDGALQLTGGDDALRLHRARIADESGVETLLPRHVEVGDGLAGWDATPEWRAEEGVVSCRAGGTRAALLAAELPARYQFEAVIRPGQLGEYGFAGLVFGADPEGTWKVVGVACDDTVEVAEIGRVWNTLGTPGGLREEERGEFRLCVDVRPGRASVFLDGVLFAEQDFPPNALRGGVGLIVADGSAEFADLRLRVPTGRYFRD